MATAQCDNRRRLRRSWGATHGRDPDAPRGRTPSPEMRPAISSAIATLRCFPPVQPTASVTNACSPACSHGARSEARVDRRPGKAVLPAGRGRNPKRLCQTPVKWAKSQVPVGIRKEPTVDDQISVHGQSVLEPKRHDGDLNLLGATVPNASSTRRRSWCTLSSEVSMSRSALPRSSRSISRSWLMPSTRRPSACKG